MDAGLSSFIFEPNAGSDHVMGSGDVLTSDVDEREILDASHPRYWERVSTSIRERSKTYFEVIHDSGSHCAELGYSENAACRDRSEVSTWMDMG